MVYFVTVKVASRLHTCTIAHYQSCHAQHHSLYSKRQRNSSSNQWQGLPHQHDGTTHRSTNVQSIEINGRIAAAQPRLYSPYTINRTCFPAIKSTPLPVVVQPPHLTQSFWAHMSLPPKWHLDQFIRFCTAHPIRRHSWRRGVVVSGVRRMNEVNPRRAWLVPGWVTVFGRVYHFGM